MIFSVFKIKKSAVRWSLRIAPQAWPFGIFPGAATSSLASKDRGNTRLCSGFPPVKAGAANEAWRQSAKGRVSPDTRPMGKRTLLSTSGRLTDACCQIRARVCGRGGLR